MILLASATASVPVESSAASREVNAARAAESVPVAISRAIEVNFGSFATEASQDSCAYAIAVDCACQDYL